MCASPSNSPGQISKLFCRSGTVFNRNTSQTQRGPIIRACSACILSGQVLVCARVATLACAAALQKAWMKSKEVLDQVVRNDFCVQVHVMKRYKNTHTQLLKPEHNFTYQSTDTSNSKSKHPLHFHILQVRKDRTPLLQVTAAQCRCYKLRTPSSYPRHHWAPWTCVQEGMHDILMLLSLCGKGHIRRSKGCRDQTWFRFVLKLGSMIVIVPVLRGENKKVSLKPSKKLIAAFLWTWQNLEGEGVPAINKKLWKGHQKVMENLW